MELSSNSQISSQLSLKRISSWIQLEEVKLSKKVSIPRRVRFYLNGELLQQLAQIRHLQQSLPLPPRLLNQLRYYALLNSPLEQVSLINYHFSGKRGCLARSGLIFDTDYFDVAQQGSSLTLLRSVINSEGKITQQVHQDLLHNPKFLEQLATVHYWLIAEIMAQLPCKSKYFSCLVWMSLLTLASIICLIINYYFSLSLFVNLAILGAVLIIFQTKLTSKLISWFKSQLIYHLVVGLLVKDKKIRHIASRILMFRS